MAGRSIGGSGAGCRWCWLEVAQVCDEEQEWSNGFSVLEVSVRWGRGGTMILQHHRDSMEFQLSILMIAASDLAGELRRQSDVCNGGDDET